MASSLLINESPLQVLPTLARRIGLNEAIVLQQIHYWLNPQFNKNLFEGRYWVRNTHEQWQKQFPFRSERTLWRTIGNLEESGLLVSCMAGHLRQIKFYTINYDLLNQIELIHPGPLLLAKTDTSAMDTHAPDTHVLDEQSEEKEKDSKTDESKENRESPPSGQNGQLIKTRLSTSKWPNKKPHHFNQNLSGSAESKVIYPNWARLSSPKWPDQQGTRVSAKGTRTPGQSGQVIWPKWPASMDKMATPSGQNVHLSYIETTVREYSKNTLPPLLPLSTWNAAHEKRQEEEEKEGKKFKFENAGTRVSSKPVSLKAVSPRNQEPSLKEIPIEEIALEERRPGRAQNESTHAENTCVADARVFSEMITIWNQTVQAKLNPGQDYLAVHLTDRRKALLKQFLNTVFADKARHEQLDAWKDYCTLIARLRFLTGENSTGFKVTLEWALVPGKAYKVLEGGIYDKPKPIPDPFHNQSWEELEAQIRQINAEGTCIEDTPVEGRRVGNPHADTHVVEAWLAICKNLAKNLGHATFKSWFLKARLVQFTTEAATIEVETTFIKDYIESRFWFEVVRAIQAVNPAITQISFGVPTVGVNSGEGMASQTDKPERGDRE